MKVIEEKKFTCEICKYTTDRLFNINLHYKTKKHIKTVNNKTNLTKILNDNKINNNIKLKCEYCENIFYNKSTRTRHYKTCKMKLITDKINDKDVIIKKLKEQNEEKNKKIQKMLKMEETIEELKYIEQKYIKLLQKIAVKSLYGRTLDDTDNISIESLDSDI